MTMTSVQASALAPLLVITMSAGGGAWFPFSFRPGFMQPIARFTIVHRAIAGFGGVLWAGNSFAKLPPALGILLRLTAVAMTVAVWRFNRSRIFD